MINLMVRDVVAELTRRLAGIKSVADVRAQNVPVIAFSDAMRANVARSRNSCSRACIAITASTR